MASPVPLEAIEDPDRAAAALDPLRARILEQAREPSSATAIAAQLGLSRQRVNYHVKALAVAGLLRKAGTQRKRNLVEQRYVATARTYVIAPRALGPVAADPRDIADPLSAAYLLAVAARTQQEVATAMRQAAAAQKRIATLSIDAELRFASARQRAGFARALAEAITKVVAEHSDAYEGTPQAPTRGRPFRLVVACHPVPTPEAP